MSNSKHPRRVQSGWAISSRGGDVRKAPCTGKDQSQKKYLYTDPKQRPMPAKPPAHFSWVIKDVLAGSALPSEAAHLNYFKEHNIKFVVALTGWRPSIYQVAGLKQVHMPVPEFEAPTLQQAIDFVLLVDQARQAQEGVVVHCHWGVGRTGTMLACYLAKEQALSAVQAIQAIRRLRPYSIETQDQEDLVQDYVNSLNQS